jgi:hypothetical protein
MCSWLAIYGF